MKIEADKKVLIPLEDPSAELLDIEDEALASVSGGCCAPGQTTGLCTPCPPLHCF